MSDRPDDDRLDSKPPLLGSWRNLYGLLLVALASYIGIGAAVTWMYAP